MDLKRAEDIVHSKDNVDVTYNEDLVWIESLNKKRNIVEVRKLNNDEILLVPVSDLKENQKAPKY